MDGSETRIQALELQVRRLEARVQGLERRMPASARESGEAATDRTSAQAPSPPPPPARLEPSSPVGSARPGALWGPASSGSTQRPAPSAAPSAFVATAAPSATSPSRVPTAPSAAPPSSALAGAPATPGRVSLSLRDVEERFAGRALAWIGGLALVAAAVFFLSLAFSRGWITEPMRVAIGLGAGTVAFAAGAVLLARKNALLGNVLAGVGLGIISVSLLAATRLYGLVPPEIGLLGALVAAIAAAAVAIRFDARSVAVFGLVAALAAPPLVGASPTLLTLLFVAVTLVGTTAIALFRSWPWLPSIAFVLAAPQLASWVAGDPQPAQALVALAGFWAINIVAAAGTEVRVRRDDLRPSSALLVTANAVFLLWGLVVVLDGEMGSWLGTAIALSSLAHLLLGGWFLRRQGLEHLFGNLVAGIGVALVAIAALVQLGAAAVPLAWSAEAVALTWLAVRRRHRWSAAASLVLGGLAIAHLLLVEYPLQEAGIPAAIAFDPALLHPEAASLAAVLLALVVAGAVVPVRWIRSALAATGIVLASYAATFEFNGPWLMVAFVVVGISGLVLDRGIARLPVRAVEPVASWTRFGWFASSAALLPGVMAIVLLFSTEFPPSALGTLADTPFLNAACLSLLIGLVGLLAAGILVPVRWVRSALGGIGILLVGWALPFQVAGVELVGFLALLLPVGVILDRALEWARDDRRFRMLAAGFGFSAFATVAGAGAWISAALYALATALSPANLGPAASPWAPLTDDPAIAGALLAGTAIAAAVWTSSIVLRRVAVAAAIVTAAWTIPFLVGADLVVVLWVALAGAAMLAGRRDPAGIRVYAGLASGLWVLGAGVLLGVIARPDRLWIEPFLRADLLPLWPLAPAALAVAAYIGGRIPPFVEWRTPLWTCAGIIALYAGSVAIVDAFARQAGGTVQVEELAKQAQVALSVFWTSVGAVLVLVGATRRRAMLRHAGFGLLALATVKVFLIDLSSMDVAYRAVVLAGLGLLLLASAFVVTRFRGPRAGPSDVAGGPHPAT